ncbi:MAG: polyhydroxyalkanoate synthesis repressor PhaR [Gammaproteobacteria bacterium]|nr:MAG: polyhydroxyalkanoate synthesis repressor PhaR [Gammaproteobacteria bacterium]
MGDSRIIKKYPNRRLYDTAISSYITLEDVKRLIRDDVDFHVVDAKTKEDITRSVMLQIITDYEDRGQPILTTEMLAHIIRFYGDALQGFMSTYLEKSMQVFVGQQDQFRKQIDNLVGTGPWNLMTDLTERNLDMWRQMQTGFLSEQASREKEDAAEADEPSTSDSEPTT